MELLSALGSKLMGFIRTHDFGAAWQEDSLDDLFRFGVQWDDAEHEFIDAQMNESLQALTKAIDEFRALYASSTFPHDDFDDRQWIPHDWPEKERQQVVDALNERATAVWKTHQELVRFARQRLAH